MVVIVYIGELVGSVIVYMSELAESNLATRS